MLREHQIVLAGGAGGLGSATARLLAEEGARLIVSYLRNAERAGKLTDIAEIVQADITLEADRRRLLDGAPQLYGLVVFTGDPCRVNDPAQTAVMLERSHAVNHDGPILLAREAASRMRAAGMPGAIVLFSTMQALALWPGSTVYASAKAALVHSARVLAKECRGRADIRVNVIAPGVMAAGMAESSIAAGKYARYIDQDVVPRYGSALDIARAVRYFLTPDSYVTGQVLLVDGGLNL